MTDTMTLPQHIRQMDADRLRRYAENLAFYAGDQWPAAEHGGYSMAFELLRQLGGPMEREQENPVDMTPGGIVNEAFVVFRC